MSSFDSGNVKAELNQYWYSPLTIQALLSEATHHATRCAFLSAPSLYFALGAEKPPGTDSVDDNDAHARAVALRKNSKLFEFDRQWQEDPGFVFYDFRHPEQVPIQYMDYFDYVIVDPPFITKEVWARYAETIKLIIKRDPSQSPDAVGTGNIRDCLGGGKVLFTTVLENHTMLEGLINGPLFIPRFRPYVCNLVYQYVCFLNYDATRLQRPNPEVPEDDEESRKLWAAIGMANDIRHSETAFALQMETRDRDGEVPLPTLAHELDMQQGGGDGAVGEKTHGNSVDVPFEQLRWGYVPEGLTAYPDGNTPPAEVLQAAQQPEEDPAAFGPVYVTSLQLREALNEFKGGIDRMQKILDAQMKLRHQRIKLNREKKQLEEAGATPPVEIEKAIVVATDDIAASEAERAAHLNGMEKMAAGIVELEQRLAQQQRTREEEAEAAPVVVVYEGAMAECVAAYRAVEVKKVPLQELAADATRKFKSPVFSRMTELLKEMKQIKKEQKDRAAIATATA